MEHRTAKIPATTSWFCDKCGGIIETAEAGMLQWVSVNKSDDTYSSHDMRIVHHPQCQFNEDHERQTDGGTVRDHHLNYFLGADGLMILLGFIAQGEHPTDDVLEIIKRLHIPGYEVARQHFDEAIADGELEPSMTPGYYYQSQIAAAMKYHKP